MDTDGMTEIYLSRLLVSDVMQICYNKESSVSYTAVVENIC